MDRQVMADLLRRTLEKKGIEQQAVAAYLGVHPTLVNKWARRKNPVLIPCHYLPMLVRFTGEERFITERLRNCLLYDATAHERLARKQKMKCSCR